MVAAAGIAALLSGCTPSTSSSGSTTTSGGGATTIPASASATAGATSAAATTSAAAPTSATTTATAAGVRKCVAAQLTATLGAGTGGGAGHQYPYLVLTNKGSTPCTVTGYPGVSFVGNGNGTQLGAPAARDAGGIAITTLTLAPGAAAHAQLDIVNAGNFDASTCNPKAADGLRVYPPDDTSALFVAATGFTACQNASVIVIHVRPLQAGAA